jgi:hypothetical protein
MEECRTFGGSPATTQARIVMYDVDIWRSDGITMTGITAPWVDRTQCRRTANIFEFKSAGDECLVDAHPVGSHRQRRVRVVLCASSCLFPRDWRTGSGSGSRDPAKRSESTYSDPSDLVRSSAGPSMHRQRS